MLLDLLQSGISVTAILLYVLGFILSIGFHEFSHAKSAQLFGDPTPEYQGRVTLNPLAHLDPIGTFMMFFTVFGWGKPVEVNPGNMGSNADKKYFIVSIMGPITNFLLAGVLLLITWVYLHYIINIGLNENDFLSIYQILKSLFLLNVFLGIFNLIPLPPLDGSKIYAVLVPAKYRDGVEMFLSRYSIVLLFALILPIIPYNGGSISIFGFITSPIAEFLTKNVFSLIN